MGGAALHIRTTGIPTRARLGVGLEGRVRLARAWALHLQVGEVARALDRGADPADAMWALAELVARRTAAQRWAAEHHADHAALAVAATVRELKALGLLRRLVADIDQLARRAPAAAGGFRRSAGTSGDSAGRGDQAT
jgi:hypothetical protein